MLWPALASRLLLEGLGTPLGYLNGADELVTNPGAAISASGKALFIMVGQDAPYEQERVEGCIEAVVKA